MKGSSLIKCSLCMRREQDDFTVWKRQQENRATPASFVYPQMPPRFRRCRRFAQALFVVEWGLLLTMFAGLLLGGAVMLFRGIEASWGDLEALITFLMCFVPLLLRFFIRLLRKTAKLFWRCPCCRQPFPYYAPDGRVDALREKDCYASLRHLRIPYVKTKLCPLVIPSECPSCRRKFFEMEQNSLNGGKHYKNGLDRE